MAIQGNAYKLRNDEVFVDMSKDAKIAEKQRLAEALRANLKRRKAAGARPRPTDAAREPAVAPGGDENGT